MKTWKISEYVVLVAMLAVSCPLVAQVAASGLPHVTLLDAPALVYSTRADDPWNTIFYFLFSRRLQVRLSQDFPEGAPFVDLGMRVQVSQHVFERNEIGDRAIDPMYPTFSVGFGSMVVLRDPAYPKFVQSLRTALDDNSPRSVVARALMQSDLWGAYDALFVPFLPDDEKALGERRKAALGLIGRLMRKIALTPEEIRALPENYSAAVKQQSFPDVFGKDQGWIEVKWFLPREHDDEAEYRRVSRVFLKPAHPPFDMEKFLNSLADHPTNPNNLDGVALITQLLLLDSHGDLQPTRLTVEAQVRFFDRSHEGKLKTALKVCEISRRLLMKEMNSGGLAAEDEWTPAYLGGYRFAEGQLGPNFQFREPIQVKLQTRCARCHDDDLRLVRTFAFVRPPHVPPVKQLDSAGTEVADFDISVKRKQQAFHALLEYFR